MSDFYVYDDFDCYYYDGREIYKSYGDENNGVPTSVFS